MAGTLSVQTIQGLATAADPTTVSIASGHKLHSPGTVVQVVHNSYNTQTSINTLSYTYTGLGIYITPKFSTSKMYINIAQHAEFSSTYDQGIGYRVTQTVNSVETQIFQSQTSYDEYSYLGSSGNNNDTRGRRSIVLYDTPNTAEQILYKTYIVPYRIDYSGVARAQGSGNYSFISVMEIAQ